MADDVTYWEGGWIREGHLAICPECKMAQEGTVSWGLAHEARCDWRPAGTWLKVRIAAERAQEREDALLQAIEECDSEQRACERLAVRFPKNSVHATGVLIANVCARRVRSLLGENDPEP